MGFIINRFDKLMELKRDPELSNKFRLVAVIIHDLNDKDFCDHLRNYFLNLAELTGKNFLFITFIKPPKKYYNDIKEGKYEYAKMLVSETKQRDDTEKVLNPIIRDYYSLPQDGSFMILAKKLSDDIVYKIPLKRGTLPYMFMDITSYSNQPKDFNALLHQLEAESFNMREIFADSLLKLVSLISPSPRLDQCSLYYWAQRETAANTLREMKLNLTIALKHSNKDEDLSDKVLNLYNAIEYAFMNVFNEGKGYNIKNQECENYKLLDNKSKIFWNTYSRLSVFLDKEELEELDYSAFIMYLGKIVETELNLSVCQMLRQAMCIPMPDFFNKYCNNRDITIIPTKKKDVPLNKYKKMGNGLKRLEGVPLGDLLSAYKTAIGLSSPSKHWIVLDSTKLVHLSQDLIPKWEGFAKVRNDAAHTQAVNQNLLENAKVFFNQFLHSYIQDLHALKSVLRS